MYQISNEKFGLFVTELRKKKNLTQKDLAEKLYVYGMIWTEDRILWSKKNILEERNLEGTELS